MYIEPNTTIQILRDVPLDPTYEHTLYWDNLQQQTNYFVSKRKHLLSRQSYQRVGKGVMNISKKPEDLYDCNYLMFNNESFGNKWFYAFLKSVEYVNNGVSRVEYEIDVMQTWFFDYRLGQCYVEREHSSTDAIGDNLIDESIPIGDYIYEDANIARVDHEYDDTGHIISNITVERVGSLFKQDIEVIAGESYSNDYAIIIAAPFILNYVNDANIIITDAPAGFYNGAFSGLFYNIIPLSEVLKTQTLLSFLSANGMSEKRKKEIVGIFIMPTPLASKRILFPVMFSPVCEITTPKYYTWNTYSPRNKKLFTYPYNKLHITTSDGRSSDFKYEMFKISASTCNLVCEASTGIPPQMGLTPLNYNVETSGELTKRCYNYTMFVNNFPFCSWVTDSFRAWLAQNAGRIGLNALTAATALSVAPFAAPSMAAVAGATALGVDPTGKSAIRTVGQTITDSLLSIHQAAQQPDQTHGTSRGMLALGCNEFGYHFYNARVRDDYALLIDEYFDRFGYATKVNKVPNRNVRLNWTFTKTVGCLITGSVPSDDEKKICSIYDAGITFWANPENVGNYTLDNRPRAEVHE